MSYKKENKMKEKKVVFEKLTVEEKERIVGGDSPHGTPEYIEGPPVAKPKGHGCVKV